MKRLLFCLALGVFSLGYGQGNDKILKATYTHHVILSEKGDFDTVLYADVPILSLSLIKNLNHLKRMKAMI